MLRVATSDNTGRAGVHGVGLLVHQELQWKFREQHESDTGIDAIIEVASAGKATGKLIAVQLFQRKRDFIAQIQAGLPVYLKLGCQPLLGDEASVFTKLMGLVGIKVALATLIPGAGALGALSF